jgi:hypothetical protein
MRDSIQDLLARAVIAATDPDRVSEGGPTHDARGWLAVWLHEPSDASATLWVSVYVPAGGAYFVLNNGPDLTTVHVDASALWQAAVRSWNSKVDAVVADALRALDAATAKEGA